MIQFTLFKKEKIKKSVYSSDLQDFSVYVFVF